MQVPIVYIGPMRHARITIVEVRSMRTRTSDDEAQRTQHHRVRMQAHRREGQGRPSVEQMERIAVKRGSNGYLPLLQT